MYPNLYHHPFFSKLHNGTSSLIYYLSSFQFQPVKIYQDNNVNINNGAVARTDSILNFLKIRNILFIHFQKLTKCIKENYVKRPKNS